MSRHERNLTPIERFLGPAAATGSPFDLLGVSPTSARDADVQAALRRRLARVASRADGGTPEAGEVRLALHAAAAQLCDAPVRAHLQAIWSVGADSPTPALKGHTAARSAARSAPDGPSSIDMFRASALRILARSGGWNRRSRRRVAALAHAMGLRPGALATALRATVRVNGAPRVNGAARALPVARVEVARVASATPVAIDAEPATRAARDAGLRAQAGARARSRLPAVGLAALALAFAVLAAGILFRAGSPERASVEFGGDAAQSEASAPQRRAASDSGAGNADPTRSLAARSGGAGASAPVDADALRRAVSVLVAATVDRSTGADAAGAALASVASGWASLAPEKLGEAALASARLWMQGAQLHADAQGSLRSPQAAQRDAFVAGIEHAGQALARTESESAALRAFVAGGRAQLALAPTRMAPVVHVASRRSAIEPKAVGALWAAWMQAAEALDALESVELPQDQRALASILALDALELVMTRAPASAGDHVDAVARALAPRVGWTGKGSTSGVAARRLLAWFADSNIGADDLAALTRALFESRAIPGLRPEMLVPKHAGRSPRLTQRDRYARLLGVEALATPQALPATWRREALMALKEFQRSGIVRSLRDAAFFARLNFAAAARRAGDSSASAQITANIHNDIERQAAGDAAVDRYVPLREGRRGDGEWAVRVRAAGRNVEEKTRALFDLEARAASLGPADADALALLALSDPEPSLRARGQRLIARLANQPAVINGALEALPGARRTLSVAGLIEELTGLRLPPPDSEQWLPEAQRALAAELLEALEGTAVGEGVDALASAIEDAHAGFLASLPAHAATTDAFVAPHARSLKDEQAIAAEDAAQGLLMEAGIAGAGLRPGGVTPAVLQQRWRVRASLASGPVQRATAWSTAMAEALALLVQAERPSDADAARRVLLIQAAMQDVARSSAEQLALAEASQTVLWMLRFGDRSGLAPLEVAASASLGSLGSAGRGPEDQDDASSAWAARVRAARQAGPWARFELAEEIAEQATTPVDRDLARRLYASSLSAGSAPGVRSVSLGLWQLATSNAERRWLLAMAQAAEPLDGPGLFDWRSADGFAGADLTADARRTAAEVLLLYSAGERGQAWRLLQATQGAEAALRRALHGYPGRGDDALLEDMRTEPTCRQCHNARFIKTDASPTGVRVCPVCFSDPGPDLDGAALMAVLRAELKLLGGAPSRWSSTLRSEDVQPIAVLEPALLSIRFGEGAQPAP